MRPDLDDHLSRHRAQAESAGQLIGHGQAGRRAERRAAVVQRNRTALVLDPGALVPAECRDGGLGDRRYRALLEHRDLAAVPGPQLRAMQSTTGEPERPQPAVDVLERTTRDDGERAAETRPCRVQHLRQSGRRKHSRGMVGDLDERPIEIQEQRIRRPQLLGGHPAEDTSRTRNDNDRRDGAKSRIVRKSGKFARIGGS